MQVTVYSSCEAVQLELNGAPLGEKPVSAETKLTARFEVPYAAGELTAVGVVKDQPVAKVTIRSAGPPRRLRLVADRPEIRADRNDLAYVAVNIEDEAGNLVPSPTIPVRFEVSGEGELAAVGSGNPSDAASFRAPVRSTFHGRCLAILRPKGKPGTITLRAAAEGLAPSDVRVTVR